MDGLPTFKLEDSEENEDDEGRRRSKRRRFSPLKFWKGERLIVKGRKSGMPFVFHLDLSSRFLIWGFMHQFFEGFCPVPVVAEVIKVDSDQEEDTRRSKKSSRSNSSRIKREFTRVTRPEVTVLDYFTGEEIEQRECFCRLFLSVG